MRQARLERGDRAQGRLSKEILAEGPAGKRRPAGFFKDMGDAELVGYAQGVLRQGRLKNPTDLIRADGGLYTTLRNRGLLGRVEFEKRQGQRPKGFFTRMSDAKLAQFAQEYIRKRRLKKPIDLQKADPGLYRALGIRGLLGKVRFEKRRQQRPRNFFKRMDDAELVGYAQKIVEEKKVEMSWGLGKADRGVYNTLRERGLLDKVEFDRERRPIGFFTDMGDAELVDYAQEAVGEKKVKNPEGLRKADGGLYTALYQRGLLGRVGFERRQQRRRCGFFTSMSDDELVTYAQGIVKDKDVKGLAELARLDGSLYGVLRKRRLLRRVFAELEQSKEMLGVRQVVEALGRFGDAT